MAKDDFLCTSCSPSGSSHAGLIKGLADQGLGGQPAKYNMKLSTALDTVKVVNLPTTSLGAVPFSRQSDGITVLPETVPFFGVESFHGIGCASLRYNG